MDTNLLKAIWDNHHRDAAWLAIFSRSLSKSELDWLSDYDDRQNDMLRDLEAAWRKKRMSYERPEVDAAWARGRRQEFLAGRLTDAKAQLMAVRLERGRMVRSGDDDSAAFLGFFESEAAAEIHKLREQVERLEAPPAEREDRIPDEMIHRAREVRMGALLGVDERKRVSCPFHGEDRHPSASIARGFFKCFTCGKGPIDALTWLMEVDGYAFPAAVRRLAGVAQ